MLLLQQVVERHVKVVVLLAVVQLDRLIADTDDLSPPEDVACLLVFAAEIGLAGGVGKVHGLTACEVVDAPPVMHLHIVILGKEVTASTTYFANLTVSASSAAA